MIPVLAVSDPEAGAAFLCSHLGFIRDGRDALLVHFGDQKVKLVGSGEDVPDLIGLPFDHLALRVADADETEAEGLAKGALRHKAFTPDGPHEIAEFGTSGVRFIFFEGPDGWPFEFCAQRGSRGDGNGHGHYGMRCASVADMSEKLAAMGAKIRSKHMLNGPDADVHVAFLGLDDGIFELFDEPPVGPPAPGRGWIGFLP